MSRAEQEAVLERFRVATEAGDLQGLLDVMAPGVVLLADGGGVVPAVRHPIEGSEKVAALLGGLRRLAPDADFSVVWLNGAPALRVELNGRVGTTVSIAVEEGRITRIYVMRNPEKLARLDDTVSLSRVL